MVLLSARVMEKARSTLTKLGCIPAMLILAPHAGAQTVAASAWQFEATPYIFASAMKGDVKAGALPKTSIDLSFSDILEQLDLGFMGTLEARKGRWMVLADVMYMRVSGDASTSGVTPAGAPLTVGADATIKQTMFAAALGYRVVEGATALDLLAGGRYNRIDADANIGGSLFGVTGSVDRQGDKSWWDPYIGVRLIQAINDRWNFVAYADVGGGIGAGSDSTWQALVGLNYGFSKTVTGKIGYRVIKVDYDRSGFLYDMKNDGLVVGVGIKF